MIQPSLIAYSLESEQPYVVQCDLDQLKPEIVLLVDSFFHILIWKGSVI